MNPTVISNAEWLSMLTALIAVAGPWAGAKVKLFKTTINPTPSMTLEDFDECDFTGYAESTAVVWGAPGFLPSGVACVVGGEKTFKVAPDPTILNTVYGYYLVNAADDTVIFARKFDAPVVLSGEGQFLQVTPSYPTYQTM